MGKKSKHRHVKKWILALILAAMVCMTGCNPVRTVLGVGELYGETTAGLILVLLDSGELETMDGEDPSNRIYIGHQERPEDDPDQENKDQEDDTADKTAEDDSDDGTAENGTDDGNTDDGIDDGNTDGGTDDGNTDDGADDGTAEDDADPDQISDKEDFRKPAVDYYVYHTLDSEEQGYYDQMLDCISEFDDAIVIEGADPETIARISTAILADHGDLFWYEGTYSYSEFDENGVPATSFMPEYTMTEAQRDLYEPQVDNKVDQWLSGISSKATDYEKVKYVYEILVDEVTYDLSAENNQNILSTFLNERTVCAGFSHAAQVMLQELGVSCTYLTGYGGDERHAWNMVCVDDVYYYMDVTWGNPSYLNTAGTGEPDYIDYSYLNMTYEEISKDHTCENFFALPETSATEANYFVMEEKYFDTDDFSAVSDMIDAADKAGENLQIKFATDELYAKALNELIIQQGLYKYCPDLGAYTYSFRENAKTLYFFFDTSVL